ncbi:hypothetical protein J6590_073324 [Homalodisca vitripennis]|nr:hypothetical protein J6590_073324 [Homalodisca vitripennis]
MDRIITQHSVTNRDTTNTSRGKSVSKRSTLSSFPRGLSSNNFRFQLLLTTTKSRRPVSKLDLGYLISYQQTRIPPCKLLCRCPNMRMHHALVRLRVPFKLIYVLESKTGKGERSEVGFVYYRRRQTRAAKVAQNKESAVHAELGRLQQVQRQSVLRAAETPLQAQVRSERQVALQAARRAIEMPQQSQAKRRHNAEMQTTRRRNFVWLVGLFRKGKKKELQPEDIYDVLDGLESNQLGERLERRFPLEGSLLAGLYLPVQPKLGKEKSLCYLSLGNLMDVQERHITNSNC